MTLLATTKVKRAGWTRIYQFDFSAFDELASGSQTLTGTPTISCAPDGLTVGAPSINGNLVQGELSGGEAGTIYTLDCTVQTSGGATLSQKGYLQVVA